MGFTFGVFHFRLLAFKNFGGFFSASFFQVDCKLLMWLIFTQVNPMWFLMSWEEEGVEMEREVPEFRTMKYLPCGKKKSTFGNSLLLVPCFLKAQLLGITAVSEESSSLYFSACCTSAGMLFSPIFFKTGLFS